MKYIFPKQFRDRFGDQFDLDFKAKWAEGQRLSLVADLFRSLTKEWVSTMTWQGAVLLLAACALGGFVGFVDFNATEVQGTILVLLCSSFFFGLLGPRKFWLWALIIGGGVPLVYFAYKIAGISPREPVGNEVAIAILPIIPALIGTSIGAGIRALATWSVKG